MAVFTILIVLAVLAMGAYLYIRRTPHGMVEFKSGLVLKFLPSLDAREPIEIRADLEKFVAKNIHKVKVPIHSVSDHTIPTRHGEIEGRLYNDSSDLKDRVILFFHGGGFCIGSIDTHNEQARRVAKATQLPLLSINYSLSPEAKFPKAHEECIDALLWIKENYMALGATAPQVVTMGDSAGGNLAIASTMAVIKMGHEDLVTHSVPVYPVTDGSDDTSESYQKFGEGYYLTKKAMNKFMRDFLAHPEDVKNPMASPILEKDLSKFPPSFILTAGFDPLRDQGEAFVRRLKEAGCQVKHKRYDNAIHAFFALKDFGQKGLDAVDDIAQFLLD